MKVEGPFKNWNTHQTFFYVTIVTNQFLCLGDLGFFLWDPGFWDCYPAHLIMCVTFLKIIYSFMCFIIHCFIIIFLSTGSHSWIMSDTRYHRGRRGRRAWLRPPPAGLPWSEFRWGLCQLAGKQWKLVHVSRRGVRGGKRGGGWGRISGDGSGGACPEHLNFFVGQHPSRAVWVDGKGVGCCRSWDGGGGEQESGGLLSRHGPRTKPGLLARGNALFPSESVRWDGGVWVWQDRAEEDQVSQSPTRGNAKPAEEAIPQPFSPGGRGPESRSSSTWRRAYLQAQRASSSSPLHYPGAA